MHCCTQQRDCYSTEKCGRFGLKYLSFFILIYAFLQRKVPFLPRRRKQGIAFIWWREYEDSVATFFTYNNQLFSPIKQKVKERNKESIVLGRICKKKKGTRKSYLEKFPEIFQFVSETGSYCTFYDLSPRKETRFSSNILSLSN